MFVEDAIFYRNLVSDSLRGLPKIARHTELQRHQSTRIYQIARETIRQNRIQETAISTLPDNNELTHGSERKPRQWRQVWLENISVDEALERLKADPYEGAQSLYEHLVINLAMYPQAREWLRKGSIGYEGTPLHCMCVGKYSFVCCDSVDANDRNHYFNLKKRSS